MKVFKVGDNVRLSKDVDEAMLVRMGLRKEMASEILKSISEKEYEVVGVTGFGVKVKVSDKRNIDLFFKYVVKVSY